ncbi:hypothetical protein [Pseudoalteromonas sp. NZS11]|uniref:hypothetical protein n=1 Tax=Pseudoalteromonas sp. NZS11 TaxID=2792049 RepID=UPI0018CF67FE|nr:hypothetical protein [Pseudoalteromonas sp. NZS11]MBH0078169.1 hypothetical protein [Pseudoalteromonas sp. NZS11]
MREQASRLRVFLSLVYGEHVCALLAGAFKVPFYVFINLREQASRLREFLPSVYVTM